MDIFDAIVVGAGPAGCAAAYTMAKAGLNVLVLDRGQYVGAKNMWGGAFFGPVMNELFPGFWKEAPVERFLNRHVISFMTKEDCLSVDFKSSHGDFDASPGFIILRARFDRWMGGKVEEAGAIIATGLEVTDFIFEGNQIKGVKVGDEDFLANVVVLADGVNSLLATKAKLRGDFKAIDLKQGVKEVIRLPREVIEDRFGITGDEGVVMEFVGSCTRGLPGGGFIYTNKDSLSVGVVVQLNALLKNQVKASDLIDEFKEHPAVRPLWRNGETLEYSAHLIPVSGIEMMPKLYADGIVVAGDAAAMVLGTGLILEGANFAMAAGIAAGETVIRAKEKGDFTSSSLNNYEQLLKSRFVLKDLDTFRRAPHFLENPRIYNAYPELACGLMGNIFHSDGKPRKNTFETLWKSMQQGKVSLWQIAADAMKARKAL
jgi:electron transfer flavoprotein-quinone oxidoreductase